MLTFNDREGEREREKENIGSNSIFSYLAFEGLVSRDVGFKTNQFSPPPLPSPYQVTHDHNLIGQMQYVVGRNLYG